MDEEEDEAALPPAHDALAESIRSRDWSGVPEHLRGWAVNDEIAMQAVDSNAVALARGAAASAGGAGMQGSVVKACYTPTGSHLPASLRWACTYHNEAERLRVAALPQTAPAAPRLPLHLVRLRVARPTREDVAIVMGMVRGLAEYEKEPDAVVTSEETMLRDGFGPGRMFQVCFAEVPVHVEHALRVEAAVAAGLPPPPPLPPPSLLAVEAPAPSSGLLARGYVPVAFAFSHGAYSTWTGRVLYLEDLYVLPHARRLGVSTLMLHTMARAAHVAQCARVQWSALDWNVSAVSAYVHPRIGAQPLSEWTLFRLARGDIERVSGLSVAFNE